MQSGNSDTCCAQILVEQNDLIHTIQNPSREQTGTSIGCGACQECSPMQFVDCLSMPLLRIWCILGLSTADYSMT